MFNQHFKSVISIHILLSFHLTWGVSYEKLSWFLSLLKETLPFSFSTKNSFSKFPGYDDCLACSLYSLLVIRTIRTRGRLTWQRSNAVTEKWFRSSQDTTEMPRRREVSLVWMALSNPLIVASWFLSMPTHIAGAVSSNPTRVTLKRNWRGRQRGK